MAGLRADQRNYKNAFHQHFHAYKNWLDKDSEISRRLLLVYCVECGLKYLVMRTLKIQKVDQAQEEIRQELGSHDFLKLLIRLKQAGPYNFRPFFTEYGAEVRPCTYHQICRYCIRPRAEDQERIKEYDKQLEDIAAWISEKV